MKKGEMLLFLLTEKYNLLNWINLNIEEHLKTKQFHLSQWNSVFESLRKLKNKTRKLSSVHNL